MRSTTRGIGRIQGTCLAAAGLVVTVIALGNALMYVGLAMIAVGAVLFVTA